LEQSSQAQAGPVAWWLWWSLIWWMNSGDHVLLDIAKKRGLRQRFTWLIRQVVRTHDLDVLVVLEEPQKWDCQVNPL
jgi:hypothetical protein